MLNVPGNRAPITEGMEKIMAKPIRISHIEFDPSLHLRPEELTEYEALEARLDQLSPKELGRYERLMLTAVVHYSVAVENIDRFLK